MTLAVVASLLLPAYGRAAGPIGSRQDRLDDFDTLWDHVGAAYAYLDKKATDWNRVREIHRPRAGDAATREELIHVLEETLDELYDFHAHLRYEHAKVPPARAVRRGHLGELARRQGDDRRGPP